MCVWFCKRTLRSLFLGFWFKVYPRPTSNYSVVTMPIDSSRGTASNAFLATAQQYLSLEYFCDIAIESVAKIVRLPAVTTKCKVNGFNTHSPRQRVKNNNDRNVNNKMRRIKYIYNIYKWKQIKSKSTAEHTHSRMYYTRRGINK